MRWRILTPALSEISEAADYYDRKVPGLGTDFVDEVESAVFRILQFPEAWGKLAGSFRHIGLRRFPYAIIYNQISESGAADPQHSMWEVPEEPGQRS